MNETASPPRILLAEDGEAVRALLVEILTSHGAQTVAVGDGEEAVKAASTGQFDLCILDINMPRMDGLNACARLRSLPHTAALPIIFLTVNSDNETVNRAMQAGGTDFLTKPFEPALLWHRISIQLQSAKLMRETESLRGALDYMKE